MKKEFEWLPHLENSVPKSIKGYTMSFYSIALEAWRRGISVKFINNYLGKSRVKYQLSLGEKSYDFVSSRGSLIKRKTREICINKIKTKQYLRNANIPTPEGKLFDSETGDEEIIQYSEEINYPLVVKPSDGAGGEGVIANIKNEQNFIDALKYVRYELGYKEVIVESYFSGEDYRVYVVGDEVVGVIKRIPANIVGDGKTNIEELIKNKNKLRKTSPVLKTSLISIDQELKNMLELERYSLSSVPSKGERVYLKSKGNVSTGGDPVDMTDSITDSAKAVAIKGVQAIPGLHHAGVDLMINPETNQATIIEINSRPSLRTHLFPMIGKARDIPSKLIDYYFPETKLNQKQEMLYFDIEHFWHMFRSGKLTEYKLPVITATNLKSIEITIKGKIENANYGARIRRYAHRFDLNGHVTFLGQNKLSIIVVGEEENIEKFKQILTTEPPKNITIDNLEEKIQNSPVKIGFVIKNAYRDTIIKNK